MSKLSASHLFDAMRSLHGPVIGRNGRAAPLSVERLASFLEGCPSPKVSQLGPSELARAIRHTFDLEHDQIVADPSYLLDLPTVPAGRRLRFDSTHACAARNGDRRSSLPPSLPRGEVVTGGDGVWTVDEDLSTALGVAQARDLLHRTNWIVVVVDARSACWPACAQRLGLLGRKRRVLIVWCEAARAADAPAPSNEPLEEMLAQCGMAQLGPLNGLAWDDLTAVFEALKVMGQACLVRLQLRDGDDALEGVAQTPAARSTDAEPSPSATATRVEGDRSRAESRTVAATPEAIENALGRIVAGEPGVVVVDLRVGPASQQLTARLGKRYFLVDHDDPHVWQWCAGLVAGGCRPMLLLSEVHWFETASALASLPDGIELRATAIVVDGAERVLKRHRDRTGFLREAVLAAAGDLRDFERLLSFSLAQDGLMMIWAPVQAGRPKSDRKLRLDPAESAWLARQHRAGLAERRQIVEKRFSAELAPWIAAYEQVGRRGGYIWKWCLHGVELTTLSCVPSSLRGDACDTKVLAGMFNVLIDDVADQQANGDLLAACRRLVHGSEPRFDGFAAADRRYGEFTRDVWTELGRRAKRYPCYDPYAPLLQFDLAQLFNTVQYSHLVNSNPYILNVVEHDDYSPQGMGLLSFAMIDLMCSPAFIANELGKLREAMWHAQWMARIGNLITTWQREVTDRDYSSGVFAHAVAQHDLTVEQLLADNPAQITAAIERGGHEAWFLRRWKRHRAHLQRLLRDVQSVDLRAMVRGLDRLLQTELASRGEK